MFIYVHLCLSKFIYDHLCSPTFTHVYLCSPTFTYVYLCSPTFTYIHLGSPAFTYVYLRSHTFTHVYLCSPTFTYVCLRSPMFTYVHLRSSVFTYVNLCSPQRIAHARSTFCAQNARSSVTSMSCYFIHKNATRFLFPYFNVKVFQARHRQKGPRFTQQYRFQLPIRSSTVYCLCAVALMKYSVVLIYTILDDLYTT